MKKIVLALLVMTLCASLFAQEIKGKYKGKSLTLKYVDGDPDIITYLDYEVVSDLEIKVAALETSIESLTNINKSQESKIATMKSQLEKFNAHKNNSSGISENDTFMLELFEPMTENIDTLKNRQDSILSYMVYLVEQLDSVKRSVINMETKNEKKPIKVEAAPCNLSASKFLDAAKDIDSLRNERTQRNLDSDEPYNAITKSINNELEFFPPNCKKKKDVMDAITIYKSSVKTYSEAMKTLIIEVE